MKHLLTLASVCALAVSASAQTMYNWTLDTILPGYSGPPPFPDGQIGDGSGTLIRNNLGRVISMTGTVGGNAVSLLPVGTVVAGFTLDNVGPNAVLGGNLGFAVNGVNVVLYYPTGGPFKWATTEYGVGNMAFVQNNPVAVPEPETWAMGVVFGAVGVVTVGIRRRRAAQGQA